MSVANLIRPDRKRTLCSIYWNMWGLRSILRHVFRESWQTMGTSFHLRTLDDKMESLSSLNCGTSLCKHFSFKYYYFIFFKKKRVLLKKYVLNILQQSRMSIHSIVDVFYTESLSCAIKLQNINAVQYSRFRIFASFTTLIKVHRIWHIERTIFRKFKIKKVLL